MAQSKITLDQLEPTTNPGSLAASDVTNNYSIVSPTLGADHLWFYQHSTTLTKPLIKGTGLTITGTTLSLDTTGLALLAGTQTFTGVNTFTQNILAAAVPTLGDHLVNKTYVDGLLAGVRRSSVRVASTVNGALATAYENGDTIDGIVLATGNRILLKNQTAPAENGIYVVQPTGAPVRATDMDIAAEVDGTMVIIEDGTQEGQLWYTVSEVTTLNTDAINWTKIQVGTVDTDGNGAANRVTFWADADTLSGHANFIYSSNQLSIGTTGPFGGFDTVLNTLGTTADDTKFGWAHARSSGGTVFSVTNTGLTTVGLSTGTPLQISNAGISRPAGSISVTPQSGAHINLFNGNNGTVVYGTGYTWDGTSGSQFAMRCSSQVAPTSGTMQWAALQIIPTINQTGGANGITRGIYVIPTLTAAADFRGVEINAGSSHYSLYSVSGKVRFDLGSDGDNDMYYRAATTGLLTKLANGTTGQVLIATSGAAPSWGSVPSGGAVDEGFIENSTLTIIDLDANVGNVKDFDGNNIAFTVPSNLKLFKVYLNGQLLNRTGALTNRDYTVNTTTHVLTLTNALVATDILFVCKHG